jgi:hypothetical protein
MKDFPTQYRLQPEDALYFCHIPKTAGMTFRTIVEDYFRCSEICPATLNAQVEEIPQPDLEKYRLFRGHLVFVDLPALLPNKHFVNVTMLREPVSRLISHYEYIRRTPGDPHYDAVSQMTLEEFTQKLTVGRVGKNVQTYYIAKTLQFKLEKLSGEEVLAIAKQSLDRFAFAGLLERFQDSLFLLSYIFGWKPILNSRKENAASTKKPSEALSASTLEAIRESSLLDIELYEYAQAIFAQRFEQMCQDLLAKYGTTADAATLSPELLRDRLDKHYEHRYAELQKPLLSCLNHDFCEPLWGSGWQRRECPEHEPAYRWTGPSAVSTLDLPLAIDADLLIECRVICVKAALPEALESLVLKVNNHPIPLTILYGDIDVRLFQGTIPKTLLISDAPFTRLTFEVHRTASFNIVNPRNPDTRQVGLALNYVQVFPIHLETQKSAVLSLFDFDGENWKNAINFVQNHLKPDERVVVPLLAFKVKFLGEIYDYKTAFAKEIDFQWAILHKGMAERVFSTTLKLVSRGLAPVFANDVFVVFSNHKDLSKLSYLSPHIKSLYMKQIKFYWTQKIKTLYVKYFERNT